MICDGPMDPLPCIDIVRNVVLTKLEKWAQIDPCGDVVGCTRIIPCKTPISRMYLQNANGLCGVLDDNDKDETDRQLSLVELCERLRKEYVLFFDQVCERFS